MVLHLLYSCLSLGLIVSISIILGWGASGRQSASLSGCPTADRAVALLDCETIRVPVSSNERADDLKKFFAIISDCASVKGLSVRGADVKETGWASSPVSYRAAPKRDPTA